MTGPSLRDAGAFRADNVSMEGFLENMGIATGHSIMMNFNSLTPDLKNVLHKGFPLGTRDFYIDGSGFMCQTKDMNTTLPPVNGNLSDKKMSVFSMYWGERGQDEYSVDNSVYGTGGYCIQLASNFAGRSVLTVLDKVYKRRPNWIMFSGVFKGVHS